MIGITVRAEVITCVKQSANTYLAPQYYASSAAEKLNFMSPFASRRARGRGDLGQRGVQVTKPQHLYVWMSTTRQRQVLSV